MGDETILDSHYLYRGRIVNLRLDRITLPAGGAAGPGGSGMTAKSLEATGGLGTKERSYVREVVEHGEVVAMVALDSEGRVLLVLQERVPAGKELLEIPAGGIDPGEGPREAAERELREETGFRPRRLESLGGFFTSPGFCTEYVHLFLATELEQSALPADADEGIQLVALPLAEALSLIDDGRICDAKSIAGLLLVARRRAPEIGRGAGPTL